MVLRVWYIFGIEFNIKEEMDEIRLNNLKLIYIGYC